MSSSGTNINRKLISGKVRQLRLERRWTQTSLAKLLGLSQNRLSEIERGKGSFTAEQLLIILKTFNIPVDYFSPSMTSSKYHIQNALVRLGAKHLQENMDTFPTQKFREVSDVIREALVVADSPRNITAIAPVIVNQINSLNLNKLKAQVAEIGLERRLGWLLDSVLEAIRHELNQVLTKEWRLKYKRTETILHMFLALWRETIIATQVTADDILDPDILTEKTINEIKPESSEIAKRWRIITRIRLTDFISALIANRD